ncbi:transposase [Chryseobacterium sp. ERMR1:04]|uniref:transposase n=1 Tax=Chryseobacterium sp. ERMR1:04 TaxID=1705393 RepID=UPI001F518292|nr:transposase [Chryseobacterium sp. ERMR1:04]
MCEINRFSYLDYLNFLPSPQLLVLIPHLFKEVEESGFKTFNTLTRTIILNYDNILNYFNARSTNAAAESFNAKIKNFRLQLRGVRDKSFFLFRLSKLFA